MIVGRRQNTCDRFSVRPSPSSGCRPFPRLTVRGRTDIGCASAANRPPSTHTNFRVGRTASRIESNSWDVSRQMAFRIGASNREIKLGRMREQPERHARMKFVIKQTSFKSMEAGTVMFTDAVGRLPSSMILRQGMVPDRTRANSTGKMGNLTFLQFSTRSEHRPGKNAGFMARSDRDVPFSATTSF